MDRNIDKKSLIIYSIIGVIFIGVIIGYVVYSNNVKENIQSSEIAKLEEDASSVSTEEASSNYGETENASTEIGKTIEEAKEEIDIAKKEEEKVENKTEENNTKTEQETMFKETEQTEESKETENNKKENGTTENKELKFIKPVQGEILNKFAKDNLIYSKTLCEWITHLGIDIKADKTSVVQASEEGTVKSIKTDPRYGLTVVISHDNSFETVYSNLLTAEFVIEGENVTKGQTIGTIGNSSSFESLDEYHLHFEVIKDGEYVDPEVYITE